MLHALYTNPVASPGWAQPHMSHMGCEQCRQQADASQRFQSSVSQPDGYAEQFGHYGRASLRRTEAEEGLKRKSVDQAAR